MPALRACKKKDVDAWLMDDVLLAAYRAQATQPAQFKIVGKLQSIEPLSLMMRDSDVRLKKVFDEEMRHMAINYDITKIGRDAMLQLGGGMTPLLVAGVLYLALTLPLSLLARWFEKRTDQSSAPKKSKKKAEVAA